ncbi:hypothetical protein PEC106568_07140 [Pectobacterium carotovorum subsp. carotovorum]|nr:hypothetical protein PEC106568_07140 [Pectobacterium carotovorum subsp. carotovorum]
MKLFHGSSSNVAPVITIDDFKDTSMPNVFDGLFASDSDEVAASHGNTGRGGNIFSYCVADEKIATSRDLNEQFEDVVAYLRKCYEIESENEERLLELAQAIADDENQDDQFTDVLLFPRLGSEIGGSYSWEMQRLRGRVAAHLGFDAVEMDDEHGTSYLIVNPAIIAE